MPAGNGEDHLKHLDFTNALSLVSTVTLIERAIALHPIEKDAANSPQSIDILARIAARLGEHDRAIAALEKILSIPCNGGLATGMPLTPALLRLDPMFDSLRMIRAFKNLPPRPRRKTRNKVERAVPCSLLNNRGVAAKS